MFCKKCGEQIDDEAVVCPKCGCQTDNMLEKLEKQDFETSKKNLGILMCLFLGFIGLIIGLCLYPKNTIARKTFLDGFWKTFSTIFIIIGGIILVAFFIAILGGIINFFVNN